MKPFENRVRLEINLAAIAANFQEIRRRVSPCRLMPVLKANAYELGGQRIGAMLRDAGAVAFGVAEINEALELAPLGLPVQILGNLLPGDAVFLGGGQMVLERAVHQALGHQGHHCD